MEKATMQKTVVWPCEVQVGTPLLLALWTQIFHIPFWKGTRDNSTASCRKNVTVKVKTLGVSGYSMVRGWAMGTEPRHHRRKARDLPVLGSNASDPSAGSPGILQDAVRSQRAPVYITRKGVRCPS